MFVCTVNINIIHTNSKSNNHYDPMFIKDVIMKVAIKDPQKIGNLQ